MNYKKIHDAIIDRARLREYDKRIHHLHHVVPLHEDSSSQDTVPLTVREHTIIHRIRYLLTGTLGNRLAWALLSGIVDDKERFIASEAGKVGGKTTKENKSGIFSDDWDRSSETKRRWEEGILDPSMFNGFVHCSLAGKTTKENKSGIFSDSWDRSAANTQIWENLDDVVKKERLCRLAEAGREAAKVPLWTNGEEYRKQISRPGENWVIGQIINGKVVEYKTYAGKPVDFWYKRSDNE